MSDLQEHSAPKIGSARGFGVVFAAVFAIIGLLPLWDGGAVRWWSLAVGSFFLAAAAIRPQLLEPLNRLWFRFGLLLGRFVAPVVMTALFLVTVTPIALLMRALGKDPLRLRIDRDVDSYWIYRDETDDANSSMKNQF